MVRGKKCGKFLTYCAPALVISISCYHLLPLRLILVCLFDIWDCLSGVCLFDLWDYLFGVCLFDMWDCLSGVWETPTQVICDCMPDTVKPSIGSAHTQTK